MGEEPKQKTAVFGRKPHFWLKTMVFCVVSNVGGAKAKNHGFWPKNHGFQCGFQIWEEPKPKTTVFGQKLQFPASKTAVFKSEMSLVDNCGFQPKTMVFSVVFKCGRSQGKNCCFWLKTAVFDISLTHFIENHSFQLQISQQNDTHKDFYPIRKTTYREQ